MGLDVSHDAWHGPYSSFNRFRKYIGKLVGIDLDKMEGFTDSDDAISWDTINDDIKILLYHSDCDGIISVADCAKLAVRLRELKSNVSNDLDIEYFDKRIIQFAEGCELAVKNNEELDFH